MDVVHRESGASGHVRMIYSNEHVSQKPAILEVVTHESGSSAGVVERTHYYNVDPGEWKKKGSWERADTEWIESMGTGRTWSEQRNSHISAGATVRRVPASRSQDGTNG